MRRKKATNVGPNVKRTAVEAEQFALVSACCLHMFQYYGCVIAERCPG
jgi:hypothetical protein